MKQAVFAIIIFVVGIAFGVTLTLAMRAYSSEATENAQKPQIQRMKNQFAYTSPLLECEFYPKIDKTLTLFSDKLNRYIGSAVSNGTVSDVSVYYRDLVNGPWIGINEQVQFSPASLLKVPLLMSILTVADENPSFLDETIPFQTELDNKQKQNVIPMEALEVGKNYTVNQLMEHMIMYSDNDAANILASAIPQAEFFKPYQQIGIPEPRAEKGEYFITVVEYASFFRILYNATYLNREDSERALSLLATTVYKNGLVAGVPSDIRVSHKFGERQWEGKEEQQLHDCGIIYHPVRPYILCVMTKGNDPAQMSDVVKNISKISYEEVDAQTK